MRRVPCSLATIQVSLSLVVIVSTVQCGGSRDESRLLTADMPLHLEDHLDAATFVELDAAAVHNTAKALPKPVEWRFDGPQTDWKATPAWNPPFAAVPLTRTDKALRITLTHRQKVHANGMLRGGIGIDVPAWDRHDWAEVVIRARAEPSSSVNVLGLGFNLREAPSKTATPARPPFQFGGEESAVARDGAVRTYRLRINAGGGIFDGPWRQLFLYFGSERDPGSIEVFSVSVVPRGATPVPTTTEWRFDQPQPDWKPTPQPLRGTPTLQPAEVLPARTNDALRVTLTESSRRANQRLGAGIYVDLPGWRREEWSHVIVRARSTGVTTMAIGLNPGADLTRGTFARGGGSTPVVNDGSVQTYQIRPDWGNAVIGPWVRLGLGFGASAPGSIDILSVTVIPIDAAYADTSHGLRDIDRQGVLRPAVFTHTPSRLSWRVQVPHGGRLGVALTTLDSRAPVTFSVSVKSASGDASVFREVIADEATWHERSVDLSAFEGQTVDLILGTDSDRRGPIGFWGTPILTGRPAKSSGDAGKNRRPPNVLLYVIDGGGADLMSLYGYNRRTTPNLERLAAEGVVFDRAHSNSAWTKPSTASFMTSLQHSALGGTRDWGDRIPEAAPTMAQRFHAAGYQTAVFTFHPNAGRSSALNRGVDRFQDQSRFGQSLSESSRFLQAEFWSWKQAFPGTPYWAHFQATDVHEPQRPVPPFEGLFVEAARRARFDGWRQQVSAAPGWDRAASGKMSLSAHYRESMTNLGIDPTEFYDIQRGLYDETMAHQDYQLGRFVDRLKATGEWANTILIVTADHGHPAGSHTRFGRELFTPLPIDTEGAFLDSYRTRVPLVIVAPGRLAADIRIPEPVSLVDLLPTVLDLAGLPPLERTQGRSLVPLMRGAADWETRPVILEQVERDVRTDEFTGHIEMIDGRWGASLEIWPKRKPGDPPVQPARWEAKARFHVDGQPRLLLYDLWEDPFTRQNVNGRYPDLVTKYTGLLEDQWIAHQAFAKQFKAGPQTPLTPEQLERLRSLGYIR